MKKFTKRWSKSGSKQDGLSQLNQTYDIEFEEESKIDELQIECEDISNAAGKSSTEVIENRKLNMLK